MITKLSKNDLVNFEKKVAKHFNLAKIKAPVHLYSNNEEQIIEVFKDINKDDWVFCSWRSHYQCLLKGVPEDELFEKIDLHSPDFINNLKTIVFMKIINFFSCHAPLVMLI